ncbi:MAG: nitric oxide reductase activation protein [Gammaproteobacteria bacterium]|nr:nitric oxide reductase activation protein [Gammaproteobacteria bacterium]
MATQAPLPFDDINALLERHLDVEFSFLKTEEPAAAIARLSRADQDFILNWVQRVASLNIQLAYQFITYIIDAVANVDKKIIEAWLLHAMDVYDQKGLYPAREVITNVERFIDNAHERSAGAVFEEIAGVLAHFTHGLSGRQLQLRETDTDQIYTDSETIFLPTIVGRLPTEKDNFLIYKSMVAYHWAQTRFGTFRVRLSEILAQQQRPEEYLGLFHALDTLRLDACIQRELPGLFREMQRIKQELQEQEAIAEIAALTQELAEPERTVHDVVRLAEQLLGRVQLPQACFYQGVLLPEQVETCMDRRIAREKSHLRSILRKITEDIKGTQAKDASEYQYDTQPKQQANDEFGDMEITLDGQVMPLPEQAKALTTSIIQDLGDIPDEYLQPAGPGEYDPSFFQEKEEDPDDVWRGSYHEEGAFLYNEWDFKRQSYRKNWCAVREKDVRPVYDDFVHDTLHKYSKFIKQLRKTFEAMRDEDRVLKRQPDGEHVDIDALVQALADARDGSEMSDRLFTRMHRADRNIAVVFMVDMSGSTKGWINDAERESLLLLAETLETLGDRYAIYGFSGMARKRCEIYRIKHFDEAYNDEIRARISGITPKDYTRMGFAIRHLCRILNDVDAKTRILITISDGKPDDYDHYRGEYGIEDTRRALIEARRDGIHPYCITIDKEGRDYLPHMYGPAAYTVINEVRQLPLKVSDIYRRITT